MRRFPLVIRPKSTHSLLHGHWAYAIFSSATLTRNLNSLAGFAGWYHRMSPQVLQEKNQQNHYGHNVETVRGKESAPLGKGSVALSYDRTLVDGLYKAFLTP